MSKVFSQITIKSNLHCWGKALLSLGLILGLGLLTSAQARMTDLTQVRCSDIFPHGLHDASSQDQRHFTLFVFWLSGFESGFYGSTQVDITRVQELTDMMLSECAKDPEQYCFDLLVQSASASTSAE